MAGAAFLVHIQLRSSGIEVPAIRRNDPDNKHAFKLLRGFGIEIGALHNPFDLKATVLYVDLRSREDLAKQYVNHESVGRIASVHIAAPGDRLSFLCSGVFDFVCHCRLLEHVCNPGRAIEEWLRVIRPGGKIYMIVPDKRFSFDRRRELTTTEHLLKDYRENVQEVHREHYADFLVNTYGEGDLLNDRSEKSIEDAYSNQKNIHVHTFTSFSLEEFLKRLQEHLPFRVIHHHSHELHIHFALEETK